mmetsp:Transcript_59193/g.127495  ORF Transcript_59193/g.127495 Transcript_59193/m.127495 type:complete len:210 (+) Transcript_59193:780-1409(+)
MEACACSTWEVLRSRVCWLVVSSVSHHPLCSASSLASSFNLMIMSLIIFFTFLKGSASALSATCASKALPRRADCSCRYTATFAWDGEYSADRRRSCNKEDPRWTSPGRLRSAAPETSSLDKMSMALPMASISSPRSFWRAAKSVCLTSHSDFKSARYSESAARSASSSFCSPSASAARFIFLAFDAALRSLVLVAASISSLRVCTNSS